MIDKKLMDCILGHFADQHTGLLFNQNVWNIKTTTKQVWLYFIGGIGQLAYMRVIIHQPSDSFKYLKELRLKALTHKNTSLANSHITCT